MTLHMQNGDSIQEGGDCAAFAEQPGLVPAWVPDGPALRFPELLRVIRVKRSKAYELMKSDPDFPQGIPLFDSEYSPRFWWTDQVLAWLKGREEKFKRRQEVRA